MTKIRKKYLAIAGIVVIVGGYYWYKKANPSTQPVQYKTAVAEKGTLTSSVSASGNVIVDQISTVDPTITGTVTNLSVKVGDKVDKGQLLFSIDNDQLGVDAARSYASYLQSLQSLESAKATKKQIKMDLSRASGTKDKGVLDQKLKSAEASVTSSEESVKVSWADYLNKKQNAAKRNVTAPIGGTVNAVNIKNGDDLSRLSGNNASQAPIIIGDLGTLKAQVQVNEVDVPNVSLGQKVMLKFTAIDGLSISGKVEKMDSLGTIAQGVVTYNVTVGFDTLDQRIRPEMSVSASIITGVKQNVVIVPNSAVKSQGDNYYVEILNDQSQAPQQKNVEIGLVNNTDTEIVSGVNAGDNVVTQTINPNASTTTSSQSGSGLGGGGALRALH